MKKGIYLLALLSLLWSCDKRKDLFRETNQGSNVLVTLNNPQSPVSSEKISETEFIDTTKLSKLYRFSINLSDESDYVMIEFIGSGTMHMDGNPLSGSAVEAVVGLHNFEWQAPAVGNHDVTIKLTDVYDVVTEVKFHLHVFTNLIPTVIWQVQDVGNVSPLEKKIVVNGLDQDQLYGGGILYYEYVINQDTTYYPTNQFYYVFPSAGNYLISVRAKDNDNEWSAASVVSNYSIQ